MWKEKYEALEAEHKQLVEAHDALARRVRELDSKPPSRVSASGSAESTASAGGPRPARAAASPNGDGFCGAECSAPDLERIYRYICDRAVQEEEPGILSLLVARPELQINVQRKTVQADGSTLRGALAILISEKYFDAARDFGDVRKDLIRRGFLGSKAPNLQISQALQGLVELGFLTKEDLGYQAVPGMKVHITESRT